MLGGSCSPCCGCNSTIALEAWKKLCASRVRLYLTGSIPASDSAANAGNLLQSRYFEDSQSIADGSLRSAGWYGLTQISGVGKPNASDYALDTTALFYQGKAEIPAAEYLLEPDLRPGSPYTLARDYTASSTYSIRFVGGDSLLSIILAIQIGTTNGAAESPITGTKCATTARLFVTTKRRYKMETSIGRRVGTRADIYQFPFDNGLGSGSTWTPPLTLDKRGVASISPAPTAYISGPLALSADGTNTPPQPSGDSWYASLGDESSISWQEMLESYTEIPIDAFKLSGEEKPIAFAALPHRWQPNVADGSSREWVSDYYIATSFQYTERSVYGTILGTRTAYGIYLDQSRGFAQRSQTAYIKVPGAWQSASGSIPTALPRGAGPAALPPIYYLPPSLPDPGGAIDQSKRLGVSESALILKPNPIPATGIPLAVYPEIDPGTYYTGDVMPIRLRFPDRPDIYAPVVNASHTSLATPMMVLSIGGVQEWAAYASGSGTTTLIFEYTVGSQKTSQRTRLGNLLTAMNGTSTLLPDVWSMYLQWPDQVLDTNLASFMLPASGVTVNPCPLAEMTAGGLVPPAVSRTIRTGEMIELRVKYPMPISVSGSPRVTLRIDFVSRAMDGVLEAGDTLVFRYTVTASDYSALGVFFQTQITNATISYQNGKEAMRSFDPPVGVSVSDRGPIKVNYN